MSESADTVEIRIGKTGADVEVLVDGTPIDGVQAVQVQAAQDGGLAQATIQLHPDQVTAKVDAGFTELEW